jgi:hypothetical protein
MLQADSSFLQGDRIKGGNLLSARHVPGHIYSVPGQTRNDQYRVHEHPRKQLLVVMCSIVRCVVCCQKIVGSFRQSVEAVSLSTGLAARLAYVSETLH